MSVVNVSGAAGGGGGPATIADGADVAEGITTDAAIVSDANGTVSGKLRGLVKIFADVWDSVNHRFNVAVGNFPASQTVNQVTGTNLHVVVDSAPATTVNFPAIQVTQDVANASVANSGRQEIQTTDGAVLSELVKMNFHLKAILHVQIAVAIAANADINPQVLEALLQ